MDTADYLKLKAMVESGKISIVGKTRMRELWEVMNAK